ncbi:uncharacterized protein [Vulpes vulpes]|uniref:Basic proline-rich protein-like n=1 Tax=Vulpes vulpes TaxID=9627 RepID=A0ABM5AF31_VULVU
MSLAVEANRWRTRSKMGWEALAVSRLCPGNSSLCENVGQKVHSKDRGEDEEELLIAQIWLKSQEERAPAPGPDPTRPDLTEPEPRGGCGCGCGVRGAAAGSRLGPAAVPGPRSRGRIGRTQGAEQGEGTGLPGGGGSGGSRRGGSCTCTEPASPGGDPSRPGPARPVPVPVPVPPRPGHWSVSLTPAQGVPSGARRSLAPRSRPRSGLGAAGAVWAPPAPARTPLHPARGRRQPMGARDPPPPPAASRPPNKPPRAESRGVPGCKLWRLKIQDEHIVGVGFQ